MSVDSPDVLIAAAAYEQWGTGCLPKLIGDWAFSAWIPGERSLILAKDPIGARHLYFSMDTAQITWSTVLDPLVLFADRPFRLNEEYIAGWLSFFPAPQLTPYVGIDSVPPSCFIRVTKGALRVTKYWDFDPGKTVRYRSDAEYEEHFRCIFAEAVRCRLRSDNPIVAELSGGMDSTSIVCMADAVIASGRAETSRLDTVSYYDDSEPNWNERPYFTKVEEKRGRSGCHIEVGAQQRALLEVAPGSFAATPSSGTLPDTRFVACLASGGNRVLLSGIGGDEFTGGVPTPVPELQDLLATGRFLELAHKLKIWALNQRKPLLHLFFEAVRGFFPPDLLGIQEHKRPGSWLAQDFVKRNQPAFRGYESRLRLFGDLPTFQENLSTLDGLRRQLESEPLPLNPLCEKRYPYLDRNFLEFLYAVPREQLVRPGQRRSLMRRALVGIVPDEILNRKRKAFVARGPRLDIERNSTRLFEVSKDLISSSLGITNTRQFSQTLQGQLHRQEAPIIGLMRTLAIEVWLRNLAQRNVLCFDNRDRNDRGYPQGRLSCGLLRSLGRDNVKTERR